MLSIRLGFAEVYFRAGIETTFFRRHPLPGRADSSSAQPTTSAALISKKKPEALASGL